MLKAAIAFLGDDDRVDNAQTQDPRGVDELVVDSQVRVAGEGNLLERFVSLAKFVGRWKLNEREGIADVLGVFGELGKEVTVGGKNERRVEATTVVARLLNTERGQFILGLGFENSHSKRRFAGNEGQAKQVIRAASPLARLSINDAHPAGRLLLPDICIGQPRANCAGLINSMRVRCSLRGMG
ncbi:MAG TPA: hypothetical protein PK640_00940 [Verrucomicrobiota bacterium]|nr:hypothetical protein [Verrucomicrobiota bacterium]